MKLPDWVTDPNLTKDEANRAMAAFRIRSAALHHNRRGCIRELSIDSGFSPNYMSICASRGEIPRKVENAVRALIGTDAFPTHEELLSQAS